MDKKELVFIDGKAVHPVRGGTDMFEPEFTRFRFYDDDAGEATSAPLENQDVDHTLTVDSDQSIQLRVFVQNNKAVAGDSMDDYRVAYDKNTVGFAVLTTTDTGTGIRAVLAGLTNDNATTNRTTNGIADGTGSFDAGEQSSDGLVDDMLLGASNYTEHAFGMEFVAANVANNDTFDFELDRPNSMTNTIVPRITISKAAGGLGIPIVMHHRTKNLGV